MEFRLSAYRQDRFVLVHWFMDLKNENEERSFGEKQKEDPTAPATSGFMIVRFDISNGKLYLNEYETFKYKYVEETNYMGSKENLDQFVRDYFSSDKIQEMLLEIIASDKTKSIHKKELYKYLVNNVKQDEVKEKITEKNANEYYRYNISKEENETLKAGIKYLLAVLSKNRSQDSFNKIVDLKNILEKVKHIEVSDKKTNATSKARAVNIEKSLNKVRKAYVKLKQEGKRITIYSISKEAKISHQTAKKYIDIYKNDLVK